MKNPVMIPKRLKPIWKNSPMSILRPTRKDVERKSIRFLTTSGQRCEKPILRLREMSARKAASIRNEKEKGKVAGDEKAKVRAKVKANEKEKVDEKAEEKARSDVVGAPGRKEIQNVHSHEHEGMPTTGADKSYTRAKYSLRRNTFMTNAINATTKLELESL